MIVYKATRAEFTQHVYSNQIEHKVLDAMKAELGSSTSPAEIASWKNSMQYMNNILIDGSIPEDAGIAIEYKVPLTSRRVDFIITGSDNEKNDTAVIVELKQWETVKATTKDAIVETFLGKSIRETTHPSYQAWTYASLIKDFNVAVQEGQIKIEACAYLHNCLSNEVIKSPFYAEHTNRAPSFLKHDTADLRDFICRYVKHGDKSKILYRLDNGQLRPSKSLADHLLSLLKGSQDFQMIDDQKIVYESALALADTATDNQKQVLVVEGGPGTGKSVVAINLLVELTNRRKLVHYVSRNAAPRAVYESKLAGSFTKTHIGNLFKGSGAYLDAATNQMDVLVVDEAHRLNEKSGLYQNLGENQIKEIIAASKLSVFFLDEDQRVTLKDIGSKEEIVKWAGEQGAAISQLQLDSQFRCNGSDGYLAWLDHVLQIRDTANNTLAGIDYDFRVFDSPTELRDLIFRCNTAANKARMVAGYCWPWKGKKDPSIQDVVIPEHNFAMRWNLTSDGSLWIVSPNSVHEMGCIHTCQGLEVDYIGVIIGPDFVIRNGRVVTDANKRASQDRSVFGYKKMFKENPERASSLADAVIKNTYRTLMSRGQKGCFLYCTDPETNEFFKQFVSSDKLEPRRVAES